MVAKWLDHLLLDLADVCDQTKSSGAQSVVGAVDGVSMMPVVWTKSIPNFH